MARRIDIELTSTRPDGTWTWRAAGAKAPKGVLDGSLLHEGAKTGDVLKAEADFEIEGITIVSVTAPKADGRNEPQRIEILGPSRPDAPGVTTQRIIEALRRLDDAVRDVRDHMFAEPAQSGDPDLTWQPPRHVLERSALAKDRSELLQRHAAQTAHALYSAAADTAALLERRADLLRQLGRIDYQTEIKRWQTLADQARQMAERWEQP